MRYVIAKTSLTDSTRAIIARLDKQCFPADTPEPLDNRTWWLVYHITGRGKSQQRTPVGYAGYKEANYPRHVFFCRAGILPAHRRQGLHRRLIKVRTQYARRSGYLGVVTYTTRINTTSANGLVACGFKLYNPKYEYAGQALYMIKEFA